MPSLNFHSQLVKLLLNATNVSIERPEIGEKDDGSSSYIQEHLLSKCALFVCNKLDQLVQKEEIEGIKTTNTTKLKTFWPGVDPESQTIYMSTKNAGFAQSFGVISEEFFSLMEGLRSLVLRSIEAKLELHWE